MSPYKLNKNIYKRRCFAGWLGEFCRSFSALPNIYKLLFDGQECLCVSFLCH